VRKRWQTGLAKLLVVAMLLQGMPALFGWGQPAYAEGEGDGFAASSDTVVDSTYGSGGNVLPFGVQTDTPSDLLADYTWERIDSHLGPSARQAAAMAYDEINRRVVLFGGVDSSGSALSDTWAWNGFEKSWLVETTPGAKPSARSHAAMAYDPASERVLLFGGAENNGSVKGDTWLWDGHAGAWTQVTGLANSPSARAGAQIAYDGFQLVLFGGYSLVGGKKTALGDTWLWDGSKWTEAAPVESPPAVYDGRMTFAGGQTAVLYGGITGTITADYTAGGTGTVNTITHLVGSAGWWSWDGANKAWSSAPGPESYDRWGQAMAYDGRRVVFVSGERDYVHSNAVLVPGLKLPSGMYPNMRGSLVYGWKNGEWERISQQGSEHDAYVDDSAYPGKVQLWPNKVPFPLSYASMAFDGTNFIMFGGHRDYLFIHGDPTTPSLPAMTMGETWVYGYTPPSEPGVEWTDDPYIELDPNHVNDTVSVVASVYSLGGKPVTSRGIEYRPYTEGPSQEEWTVETVDGANPQATGSFNITLSGLKWQQKYEVRAFATNEIGTARTEVKQFILENDPSVLPPHISFDRVGPSVLHVQDKKRIVAFGESVTNLLRKPQDGIDYYLKDKDGAVYPLDVNVIDARQLELTWDEQLPPGNYEVHLEHNYFEDFVFGNLDEEEFTDGLKLINADFYKPRNFPQVNVASTSDANSLNKLTLQGTFTEDPTNPGVYRLTDTTEVVTINETILFKGSSLVVDQSGPSRTVITGNGRLFVTGGTDGANASYTLHDGPFTFTSDQFSFETTGGATADFLRLNMPVKISKLTFVNGGLDLTGLLELGISVGSQKISSTIPVDKLQFRRNRFDLTGTYTMNKPFKAGPIDVKDTEFAIDSRIPYVGVNGKGSLPGTNISFDMQMKIKQGRLDGINFGMFDKKKLASTGLQVNYLFGSADNLAGKTQIPQRISVTGSVADVIVPQLKHPTVAYKFNLLGTDSIDVSLTPYGFEAGGIAYYYWLAINKMNLQAVVDPAKAGLKGFSTQGFLAQGNINAFDVIKGVIGAYSFNGKGYNGAVKATVYVPKGIPRIGGATVRDVVLSVNEKQMIGMLKHNGIAARVSYTFSNNTILFEVEAEPPKKSWWEKGLDFINNVNDFFEKTAPLGDVLEEIFLFLPNTGLPGNIAAVDEPKANFDPSAFSIASADDWMKSFDFKQFNLANNLAAATGELIKVYELTPVGLAFQPEYSAEIAVNARIVDGQLTSVDRTPSMSAQVNASSGLTTYSFKAERAHEALIALTGDQRSAVLSAASAAKPDTMYPVKAGVAYDADSDTTFLRATLSEGNWQIATNGSSRIGVHELLFANPSLTLGQLTDVWLQTPDRPVTALIVEERGAYAMSVQSVPGEVILYKPDGRPYKLQTSNVQPDWNAFLDAHDNRQILLNAVETGTWLIGADLSPEVEINRVPAQTTTAELQQWIQQGAYPTVFEMSRIDNGQAIVEVYGANANTKLYMPDGNAYSLQPDPNKSGMNVAFDEAQQKMTFWLSDTELKGQWKAVSSSYTSVIAYKTSRKFKSIKPLLDEGRYSKKFELAERGDYMLSVSGGNADTIILAPDGKPYTLNFADPGGNAYLQPAADRMPGPATGGDPLDQTQVQTPNPAQDGRDMLYVSLLDAPAGKWTVQNAKKVDLQIQKLIPLPTVQADTALVAGADNRIRVTWSTENAAADTEVTLVLTDNRDAYSGEVLAEGLAASGNTVIDIPALTIPGTYYLAVVATSADGTPAFAIAEGTVEVKSSYMLPTPALPEVLSTGNGEVTLQWASVSGSVERYRIWVGEGAGAAPATPIMDIDSQAGGTQQAVVSGLAIGGDYTIAVSAIGQRDGRATASLLSESVGVALPTPQPAQLTLSLDAGASPTAARTFNAYDGSEQTLLSTAANQATLEVASDQAAMLTLTIDDQSFDSVAVSANGTSSFALNDLLGASELPERAYNVRIEALNDRGDRSVAYGLLSIDRTAPLLIASGGDDETGAPISLNGTVDTTGKVLIVGQTEAGVKLDIDGVVVPLDDAGRFVYYAPLAWDSSTDPDRIQLVIQASDEAGNTTDYGFEVLNNVHGSAVDDSGDLAALTTRDATMTEPYQFGITEYQAVAATNRVRVYAVPMAPSSTVTIDGRSLSAQGYVEIDVSAGGRTVQVSVKPAGSGPEKQYSLAIGTGSSIALLSALTLKSQTSETLQAQPFAGTEAVYDVHADNTVESVTLAPGALMAGSGIKVNEQAVQNGQASQPISLQVGENRIPVTVVSPDGSETRNYQVVVWREANGNADLQQLGITTTGAVMLSDFDPGESRYQVIVPNATATFSLLPVAQQAEAVVRVNDQAVTGTPVSLPLIGDGLTVEIEVRAQDDSIRQYSLTVVRQKATPAQPPLLTSLEADTILNSTFSAYKYSYGTKVKTEDSSVVITAQADDPLATVTVAGVSRQGGGRFVSSLKVGENTVIVQVESADLAASQTYSIDVTRLSESSNVRQSTITGGTGDWTDQIPIVRSRTSTGSKLDTVKMDASKAKQIIAKSAQNKDKVAQIHVTDLPDDPADERVISLSGESLNLLADGSMSLQIVLPEAVIDLPTDSLRQLGDGGEDAYFRVIPIVDSDEHSEVESRVLTAELVLKAANGEPVSVIGSPVKIETNSSGFKASLLFPLTGLTLPEDEAAAARMLSELAVYIEHSDGDKVLAAGEIRYDAEGNPIGIAVVVDKFSTFTIVRLNSVDTVISETLEPYISGYPDGTFRPSQSIKRSELASILHRLGIDGNAAGADATGSQLVEYPDIKPGYWAAEAIASLQRSGLMLGDDQGLFRPEAAITRAELASILSRLLPATAAADADKAQAHAFADVKGHWAAEAIAKVLQAGLLEGYPDGTFGPNNKLTRAEAVRVLNQLLERPVAGVSASSWQDVPSTHWAIREIESASGTVTVLSDGSVRVSPRRKN